MSGSSCARTPQVPARDAPAVGAASASANTATLPPSAGSRTCACTASILHRTGQRGDFNLVAADVRLTNWDAQELAAAVKRGTRVEFL